MVSYEGARQYVQEMTAVCFARGDEIRQAKGVSQSELLSMARTCT